MADLAASGLTAEQMALVIELSATVAVEARPVEDKSAQRRRAKDRAYQAEKRRQNRTISADSADAVGFNERDNLTSREGKKPKPNGLVKKTDRGFRLPADWEPDPLTGKAETMVAAWQPGAMERELAKFKNYWLSKGANAARTDWQRTWVNWLMTADERTPRSFRNERSSNPTGEALARVQAALRSGSSFG
jgi:hypothetical protein